MSDSAAERHSRYCMLLFRSVESLMNARAATRAVAAVPWGMLACISAHIYSTHDGVTYGVLHTRHENLPRIKAQSMLPEYPSNSDRMLRTHCPTQC